MDDTSIISLKHYLDPDGRPVLLPFAVRPLGRYITAIVEAVSAVLSERRKVPTVRCRRRPKRWPCSGRILAEADPKGNIAWGCPVCQDQGLIHDWQGTPWDRSPRAATPPATRPVGTPSIPGVWRIESTELWERAFLDLRGTAELRFDPDGSGSFRFIAVRGDLDARFGERDGRAAVEFTWKGHDERDPASGRGWAVLEGDALRGRIFFHNGDDSAFTARRRAPEAPGRKAARPILRLRRP